MSPPAAAAAAPRAVPNPAKERLKQVMSTLKETPFPNLIIVELIAGCNLRCIMCPYPTLERPKGIMKMELFQKIADEIAAKGTKSQLWLAIMGEPTLLGDRLAEYVACAKKAGVNEVILNTNGTHLTPSLAQKLHEGGLDEIIFGLDANSAETYAKIRVGGTQAKTWANVEDTLATARREGWKKPRIVCQMIVMDENKHEVEDFKKYWLDQGAIVKIRPMLQWHSYVDSTALGLAPDSPERIPCPWLVRSVSIHHDGKVVQCDSDYEGAYPAGNLTEITIEEAWMGELKRRRDKHWNRDFSMDPCRNCKDWQVGLSEWYDPAVSSGPVTTPERKRSIA